MWQAQLRHFGPKAVPGGDRRVGYCESRVGDLRCISGRRANAVARWGANGPTHSAGNQIPMLRRFVIFVVVACLVAVNAACGQRPPATSPTPSQQRPHAAPQRFGRDSAGGSRDSTGVPAIERVTTTKHNVTIDGKVIPYV